MHRRPMRRAAVLALAAALASASVASADGLFGDGDLVSAGRQALVTLPDATPGQAITVQVRFELVCSGTSHPDPGQSVALTPMTPTLPTGSTAIAVPSTTMGPVTPGWPADGQACPTPAPSVLSEVVTVSFTAPTVVNSGYVATFPWRRGLTPAGSDDATALAGTATAVAFRFDVVPNTAPTLTVPGDLVVEGDTTGGWTAAYTVSASDAHDEPDPVPVCSPAPGELLTVGTTTVSCSVIDSGGLSAGASFDVTVQDTTPPLVGQAPDVAVTTGDPAGAAVTFTAPSATDIVDADPVVSCAPASGSWFAVGTTPVTCTATDDSGNPATTSFDVTVTHLPTTVLATSWLEPVGTADGGTFVTNRGRTLPVKVIITVDGVARTDGTAALRLEPCAGGTAASVPLAFGGGRWNAALDTDALGGSCVRVVATLDGQAAGGFVLELRGAEPVRAKGRSR